MILLDNLDAVTGDEVDSHIWDKRIGQIRVDFQTHMDDDLNTPRAIAALFGFVEIIEKTINQGQIGPRIAQSILSFFNDIDQVLGIFDECQNTLEKDLELPPELAQVLAQRVQARRDKDWARADELRDILAAQGVQVKDTKDGMEWSWSN